MAGLILKEDVEKVRAAADLHDIVSATVTLKPSGAGTYVGLCPFHDEKTPSFSVRPALGVWHCFGCGLGGDVFGYIEQRENVDFHDAVELLADMYHIELRYEAGKRTDVNAGSKRSRLLQANEEAQRFFTEQLRSQAAAPARKMLTGRNFTQADCERFGCGYAPQGWDALVRHLSSKGFTQQEMLDAGLVRQGQRGIYDYFRGRVTWPIRDSTGRTLGFGARRLFEDDAVAAKYINTPDTRLYRKTQALYGIDLAKANIVAKRQAVIVEGYTDVMACHLAGIDTAVATCGTAFGAEHAKMVRRLIADDSLGAIQLIGPGKVEGQSLSSRIVFTFDGDAAGQKAALHAFSLDSAFLSQTFVAVANNNLDPCDLRIQQGDEAVRSLIESANPLYDFVIDAAIGRFDTSYTTGQMGAVKAVAPLIAQIRDRSLLDMYTRKATRRIGVDLDIMRREVLNSRRQQNIRDEDMYATRTRYAPTREPSFEPTGQANNAFSPAARKVVERSDSAQQTYYKIDDAVFICEQQFMATLIQVPRAIDATLFNRLSLGNFTTPVFRSLFQAISAAGGLPDDQTPQGLWIHHLSETAGPLLAGVINELAVMPLPLPPVERDDAMSDARSQTPPKTTGVDQGTVQTAAVQLREATDAERQYARELLARLLDLGLMRRIGAARRKMAQLPDGEEKIAVLGQVTQLETQRKQMQDRVFGNTIG